MDFLYALEVKYLNITYERYYEKEMPADLRMPKLQKLSIAKLGGKKRGNKRVGAE